MKVRERIPRRRLKDRRLLSAIQRCFSPTVYLSSNSVSIQIKFPLSTHVGIFVNSCNIATSEGIAFAIIGRMRIAISPLIRGVLSQVIKGCAQFLEAGFQESMPVYVLPMFDLAAKYYKRCFLEVASHHSLSI